MPAPCHYRLNTPGEPFRLACGVRSLSTTHTALREHVTCPRCMRTYSYIRAPLHVYTFQFGASTDAVSYRAVVEHETAEDAVNALQEHMTRAHYFAGLAVPGEHTSVIPAFRRVSPSYPVISITFKVSPALITADAIIGRNGVKI